MKEAGYWLKITNDNVHAGYSYKLNTSEESDRYFYRPDHLGSTSIITDKERIAMQFVAYLPYEESLVDEHSSKCLINSVEKSRMRRQD